MCRLLYTEAPYPRDPASLLERFAVVCRESVEYQGHGWGAMWTENGRWKGHRSLTPIWEEAEPLTAAETERLAMSFLGEREIKRLEKTGDVDFAYANELGRFRASVS